MADIQKVETPREEFTEHVDAIDGRRVWGKQAYYFDNSGQTIRYKTILREDGSSLVIREVLP